VDYNQKTRYAYGYDTSIAGYAPKNKDIRIGYNNLSTKASFASLNLDSANFSYDFSFIMIFSSTEVTDTSIIQA